MAVSISWARFCLFKQSASQRSGLYRSGFNLLGEILFVQATTPVVSVIACTTVSISWARFCLFKLLGRLATMTRFARFNLLGEILFVQASPAQYPPRRNPRFQSLGRDSVCSSAVVIVPEDVVLEFQSLGRDSVCSSQDSDTAKQEKEQVSISWARFCLFKLRHPQLPWQCRQSFNLLGEILFVQASWLCLHQWHKVWFQSLGRDSVCSSSGLYQLLTAGAGGFNLLGEILFVQAFGKRSQQNEQETFQSLGRDSVCSSVVLVNLAQDVLVVSISWARFCLFKRHPGEYHRRPHNGFNLLGEILFVQARRREPRKSVMPSFQSLGRDSVCSSYLMGLPPRWTEIVSISWARFCLFKPGFYRLMVGSRSSFNLLGEILFVQARLGDVRRIRSARFQSLGRDSVCSSMWKDLKEVVLLAVSISWARFCLFKLGLCCGCVVACARFNLLGEILFVQAGAPQKGSISMRAFQSLGRDSVCSSSCVSLRAYSMMLVSISWARFCLFKR